MTIQIVAHPDASYWQADEIAECLKVPDETYVELWSLVPLYDHLPKGEVPGEITYPVSDYWDTLTRTAQLDVNIALGVHACEISKLAELNDANNNPEHTKLADYIEEKM